MAHQGVTMEKMTVRVFELHTAEYEVEAENEADAIKKVKEGFGVLVDNSSEFDSLIHESKWHVE